MAKENVNELVDKLTLFDDDLMSRVFDNNIEATELMLRIILGRNINVISVIGQDEIKKGTVGAVQPKLPLKNVKDITVKYPPIIEQKQIVEILSAIDEKI